MFKGIQAKIDTTNGLNNFVFGYKDKNRDSGVSKFITLLTVDYSASATAPYSTRWDRGAVEKFLVDIGGRSVLSSLSLSSRSYKNFGVSRGREGRLNRAGFEGVWQKEIKPFLDTISPYAFRTGLLQDPASAKLKAYGFKKTSADGVNKNAAYFKVGNVIQAYLGHIKLVEASVQKSIAAKSKVAVPVPVTVTEKTKVETKMANTKSTSLLEPRETVSALGEALKAGAQVAVADEAANAVLAVAEVLVGEAYPELATTESGKKIMKLVAASLLHHAASSGVAFIPDADSTKFACSLVMQAAARDLIQPKLALLTPALASLASVGRTALVAATAG